MRKRASMDSMRLNFLARHSLKTRVTLSTMAIFLVSLWSLFLFASHELVNDMVSVVSAQQFSAVSLLGSQVNHELTDRLNRLEVAAQHISAELLAQPAALQDQLNQRLLLRGQFNAGVLALDTVGMVIAELPLGQRQLSGGLMDLHSVNIALQQNRANIGRAFIDGQSQAPMLGMSAPVHDAKGQVIGVLTGLTNLSQPDFLRAIRDNTYGKTGGYLLVDPQERRVILASDKRRIMEKLPAPDQNPMLDRFLAGYQGTQVMVNPQGVEILASDTVLPINGWIISAVMPTDEAFAPARLTQRHVFYLTLLLTLLAGGLTWWGMRGQLAPLLDTVQTLGKRGQNLDALQPLPLNAPGEIGALITAFNTQLAQLAQRDQALTNQQQMLARTEAIAHIGSWEWDRATDAVTWSDELFRIFQVHPAQGAPPFARQHEHFEAADFQRLKQAVDLAMADGTPYQLELRVLGKGGARRVCLARGQAIHGHNQKVTRLAGSLQDITDLKQAQDATQASFAALHSILQTTLDGFWRTDTLGRLLEVNPAYCSLSGYSPQELLTMRISDLDLSEGTPDAMARINQVINSGRNQFETQHRRKDGSVWDVEVSATYNPAASNDIFVFLRNVSERKQAQLKLQLSANVFSHAFEGITITNAEGTIVDVNDAFCRITGYSRHEAIGQNPRILKSGRQDTAFYEALWQELLTSGHWSGEIWNKRKNGEVYPELITLSAVRDAQGVTHQYVALFSDISRRKAAEDKVHQLAFYDALTELPNRRMLADRLGQALVSNQRSRNFGAVLFLDLDNFKPLNDTHGHAVGDLLLVEVARRLKTCVRQMDTVARIGGDEFVLMLGELGTDATRSAAEAGAVAEKVRLSLANPYLLHTKHPKQANTQVVEHHCTASIGVTLFGPGQSDQKAILKQADSAMYQAKDAGRNRVTFYNPSV